MYLQIPARKFGAYLFDCDGTIADSMPLHYQAWSSALKPWGGQFSEERFYAWAGRPIPKIIEMLNEEQGLSMPVDQVTHRREEAYFELLPQIREIPEVGEQIRAQHKKIPLAVVSGSPRASVIKTLTTLDLLHYFDTIVGGEDYRHGKPEPEAFLLGAARLKIAPQDCLVFEDADLGIQAAIAAGMAWVKIPPPYNR